MRILTFASTFPRWHGDTVPPFVFGLSRHLAHLGHEVHVLAPHAAGAAHEEVLEGLHVHRFRYAPARYETLCYDGGILENLRAHRGRWALVPPFLAAEATALVRLVKRHRIEVVHAHWVVPQGLMAALVKPMLPCPVVMSAHGADVFAVKGMLRKRLLRFAARRADVCTANSSAMQAELKRLTGVNADVIPMGVDLAAFQTSYSVDTLGARPNGKHEVLFVGRLAEKKGVRHLLNAMASLREVLPDVRLTVVGDGPERPSLEHQARRLGLNGSVVFTGAVPNSELPAYYRRASVFVAPSVRGSDGDTEGLGVVLLEAAACGVPLVASNIGGIPDIVHEGKTGLLTEPADPQSLAAAVVRLLRDDAMRRDMAANARRLVEERFAWPSVASRFDKLFASVAFDR